MWNIFKRSCSKLDLRWTMPNVKKYFFRMFKLYYPMLKCSWVIVLLDRQKLSVYASSSLSRLISSLLIITWNRFVKWLIIKVHWCIIWYNWTDLKQVRHKWHGFEFIRNIVYAVLCFKWKCRLSGENAVTKMPVAAFCTTGIFTRIP